MIGDVPCPECGEVLRATLFDGLCPACVARRSLRFARVVAIADSPVADRLRSSLGRSGVPLRLDDYEIEGEIARGGMGVVYRARQVSLNRPVALKLLLAGQFADAAQVRRFRGEAAAVARLNHPMIVPVYEVGEYEGRHFFSMGLIEGPSLAGAMPRFALSATLEQARRDQVSPGPRLRARQRELARFVANIARTVHYAHQRGVLHRDLKPANVLLDPQGQPHVTDFGLARCMESDAGGTGSGVVFGTPAYMPPEQTVDPHNVTIAADVYSLGAIAYELLTGRPPFEAGSPVETVIQVRERDPIAPRVIEPELDRDLETVVLKCLEKDPSARYANALALAEELQRFAEGEPVLSRPVSSSVRTWRWARRHPLVATLSLSVGILLLTLAIGGPVMAFRLAEERDQKLELSRGFQREYQSAMVSRTSAERLQGEAIHRERGLAVVAAAVELSTNLTVLNEAVAQLARVDISGEFEMHPRAARGFPVAFSPDFSVYFKAVPGGGVEAHSASNHQLLWAQTNMPSASPGQFRVSPDGRHLAVVRDARLNLLRASDGARLWSNANSGTAVFGPDGQWLLASVPKGNIRRLDAESGADLPFAPGFDYLASEFALAPDPALHLLARLRGSQVELFHWQEARVVNTLTHSAMLRLVIWQDQRIAAADDFGNVVVWRLPSRRPVILRERIRDIRTLQFVPNSPLLMVVTKDGRTSCWDADEGDSVLSSSGIISEQISADGTQLLMATPLQWGVSHFLAPIGRRRYRLNDDQHPEIRQVAFNADARLMAVVKQAGVHLLDLRSDQPAVLIPLFGAISCAFLPGTNVLVVQDRLSIQWFDVVLSEGRPQAHRHREHRWNQDVWLQPGVATGSPMEWTVPRHGVGVDSFGLRGGEPLRNHSRPELAVLPGFDRLGNWIIYRRRGGVAPVLLNTANGEVSSPFDAEDFVPRFSPDGRFLLGSARQQHFLFSVGDWNPLHTSSVTSSSERYMAPAAWSSDSRTAALYDDEDGIIVRDVKAWRNIVRLTTPQPSLFTTLAFSPGRRWLAAGTDQGSVELWDFEELSDGLRPLRLSLQLDLSPEEAGLPTLQRLRNPSRLTLPGPQTPPYLERDPGAGREQLDLTRHYNAHLEQSWSMEDILDTQDSLCQLPAGLGWFDGVLFDVRGVIQLSGTRFRNQSIHYQVEEKGIAVDLSVQRLHLMGAVVDGRSGRADVCRIRFNYRDGTSSQESLLMERDIADHWASATNPRRTERSRVAWRGMNGAVEREPSPKCLELLHLVVENPHPDREVATLDLTSTDGTPAPFFVALTVE